MPGVETLRDFVNQRLTAAAEEIFGVFERTIAEYEEQLCRCKEENERQQKLLDDVQLHFHRADTQQLLVQPEDVPSEQQEWSSSLDQEDTEPPQIKEEEEELEEFDTISFPFAHVSVKTEDEEKPQSSQFHEIQSEGMKTGADGEDCGGPEQAWNSEPERYSHHETQDKAGDCYEAVNDDSDGWRVTVEDDYGLNCVKNFGVDKSDNAKKPHSCPQCSKTFRWKSDLAEHVRIHRKEKPFCCPVCGKKFNQKYYLSKHMLVHTGEKPFSCSQCDKKFTQKSNVTKHMLIHTGEKPFSCSRCAKKFNRKSDLATHMLIHTGERPFSCSQCGKRFTQKSHLTSHMVVHTGEKPFSCKFCDQKFSWDKQVKRHKCTGGETS